MKAWCQIRPQPHYRRDAFVAGLTAAGFEVSFGTPAGVRPGDVLLLWNRYGPWHDMACHFEAAGGTVLVAENGYIGADANGLQHYALAIGGHNGSGRWIIGSPVRLRDLGLQVQPWQDNPDGHVLVCGQRGIGSPSMASPAAWHDDVARRLRQVTRRKVVIRYHPEMRGAPQAQPTLAEQLHGAWACVVWSSSAGVKALVQGVPVFYEAPHWVCEKAAPQGVAGIEQPWRNEANRIAGLNEMAWAQWSLDEIGRGTAFRHLLGPHA